MGITFSKNRSLLLLLLMLVALNLKTEGTECLFFFFFFFLLFCIVQPICQRSRSRNKKKKQKKKREYAYLKSYVQDTDANEGGGQQAFNGPIPGCIKERGLTSFIPFLLCPYHSSSETKGRSKRSRTCEKRKKSKPTKRPSQ